MRSIQVSADVFQAIWSARKPGQDSEDQILKGVFNLSEVGTAPVEAKIGFHDPRYGVTVPAGFKIFRSYKGKKYVAQAFDGFWHTAHNRGTYGTLNELNVSIGVAGQENAWKAWFYNDDDGTERPLHDKRDPNKIIRRV